MTSALSLFLLGLGTTLHPCPFTTNIAIISLLAGWRQGIAGTARIGLAFALGYVATFIVLAVTVILLVQSIAPVARFFQEIIGLFIGPLLIVIGMAQTGLLPGLGKKLAFSGMAERLRNRDWGMLGAAGIGSIMALAFCPATALAFFGGVISALGEQELHWSMTIILPLAYGLGAAIPIVAIVIGIATGVRFADRGDEGRWRKRLPLIAGIALIGIGIYMTLLELFRGTGGPGLTPAS